MYEYDAKHVAPRAVEFSCRTPQGFRVVRIILDNPKNPRILAYNETYESRTPALLFMTEVDSLIDRANTIVGVNFE